MSDNTADSLHDAIARNLGAVISLPSGGVTLSSHKTRFLGDGEGGIWMQSVPGYERAIDRAIENQSLVGVAYRAAINKIIFTTTVWRRQPEYRVNAGLVLEAILIAFPESVKSVQRRNAYRVVIPSTSPISLSVWRISERALLEENPTPSLQWSMKLRDLSVSGMGTICVVPEGHQTRHLNGQRLRIIVSYESEQLLLEGRVRHIREANGEQTLRVGIRFGELETTVEGRQILSRLTAIVGHLHREEVRRLRLGIAS